MEANVQIAVVDDHTLFRGGLIQMIQSLDHRFVVSIEAGNGKEFLSKLKPDSIPEILLLDINMPILNGFETAEIIQRDFPGIKVLVITMDDDDQSLIRMLKLGVRGYIGKDAEPDELKQALNDMIKKGFYYTDDLTNNLIQTLHSKERPESYTKLLSEQELIFIRHSCSEDTYAQIADKMCLSPKTIDGYRASVFEKLNVKSRVGLAIYAIKTGLIELEN